MAASDPERRREYPHPSRKPRSALVLPALALPALASVTRQLLPGLIAVVIVVLILGLVALLRCRREDLPDIVRAIMRMGPKDDDGGNGPPSLPKP
jgi:hypothetical protein